MTRSQDLLLTAIAPAVWGSSYIVTTELLPGHPPLLIAMLRALPAGLLLLLLVRQLPSRAWAGKVLLLGALNFSLFWWLLFASAYRLPGGVAATLGAVQPLMVLMLSSLVLGSRVSSRAAVAAVLGLGGVALLVLTPEAALDPAGVAAGLGGAASMALGVVLTRRWQPPVPPLTFTAWQLTAGGVLLVPAAVLSLPAWPVFTGANIIGILYMSLIGGALTYILWFRGIARTGPAEVSLLGVLSPLSAVFLGWAIAGEALTPGQAAGAALTLFSLWLGQSRVSKARKARTPEAA